MKARLTAGSEIDFVTADEIRQLFQEFMSGWSRPAQTVRPAGGVALNAGGNSVVGTVAAAVPVFVVPAGYTLRLHRAGFFPEGAYTYGAPFTAASGYLEIRRSHVAQDGISFVSPGLPRVWTAGTADGIEFVNGESINIFVSGGPANTNLLVRLQGTLEPVVRQ